MIARRGFLLGIVSGIVAGCGGAPASAPLGMTALALKLAALDELLSSADLRWLILARPREIASIAWLIPDLGRVVPEANLDRFAAQNALDLRQVPEAALASYAGAGGEALLWLARHNGDPGAIEQAFRRRLVGGERRAVERPDVIRMTGKIGPAPSTMVLLGRDVVGLQQGGSPTRGPARIAGLYAEGVLHKSPTALAQDPLRALFARFGGAPLRAAALGPFEGELSRGARGLLAGATAIGAAARPSAREGIAVVVAVAGDFAKSGDAASRELADAWKELAKGALGNLLGLDQPVEPPLATFSPEAVAVAVELDPKKLARGLASLTSARVEEIFK